jgi:Raf kinase inhibitor-like YbhB/YbcL family protein
MPAELHAGMHGRGTARGSPARAALLCLAASLLAGGAPGEEERMSAELQIRSPRFEDGGEIPVDHTCEGRDVSPPLGWSGVPDGARSLVLVVDDPDAPDPRKPRMTWVHWVLYDLPADSTGLAEAVAPADLPEGARQGRNDWKRTGWGGPCPPIGRHRYFFKLFALDAVLPDLGQPDAKTLERALRDHVLAKAELVGTYQKAQR